MRWPWRQARCGALSGLRGAARRAAPPRTPKGIPAQTVCRHYCLHAIATRATRKLEEGLLERTHFSATMARTATSPRSVFAACPRASWVGLASGVMSRIVVVCAQFCVHRVGKALIALALFLLVIGAPFQADAASSRGGRSGGRMGGGFKKSTPRAEAEKAAAAAPGAAGAHSSGALLFVSHGIGRRCTHHDHRAARQQCCSLTPDVMRAHRCDRSASPSSRRWWVRVRHHAHHPHPDAIHGLGSSRARHACPCSHGHADAAAAARAAAARAAAAGGIGIRRVLPR